MMRSGEQLGGRRLLDDPTGVHRQHSVGDLGDDAEIVGDEHDGRSVLALEAGDQVEELGLHRDVEGRRRFVGDQQLGAQRQRHRQHDPLAHAARELMGVVADSLRRIGDADLLEQGDHPRLDGLAADRLVGPDRLADLPTDGVLRMQTGQRILEHHGDARPADLSHRPRRQGEQVVVVEVGMSTNSGAAHELEHGLGRD